MPSAPQHLAGCALLDDLAMVDSLKARGMTKANRSALIRYALGEVDLDSVPQGI